MSEKRLSDVKIKSLEEDFRKYRSLQSEAVSALISSEWKPEDLNSWIRGSTGHTEKALADLIKKESTPAYSIRTQKINAIEAAYNKLSHELKRVVEVYVWGQYSYLSWPEVAEHEHCSKSTIYEWRYKIIETYAYELGELF